MLQPSIPDRDKLTQAEYEELAARIQQPTADIRALRKAKKLKGFLFLDAEGRRLFLIPKTVIKQEK